MNSRRLSLQLWMQYILALLAWAFAVFLMAYLAFLLCRMRTWHGTEFLYPILHTLGRYVVFVYALVTCAGWLVISYLFIARPMRYLDALANASQSLAHPGEEPIVLPPALAQTEAQLNLAREKALRDAMAAREAEQRKNDLIVYLAHDLKTPLTSVIGYLTLLRDEPELSPEFRARYTGVALNKAERLEELINEFFDITRFNLTTLTLDSERICLSRMLEQLASESAPILAERELEWRLEIAPEIEVMGDADKLARAFDNLIRNAVSYSYAGTEILLFAQAEGDKAKVMIKNHGKTIAPDKLEHIFEQFYRADAARSSATGGAGLGLAITKEIVELHGGTVTAASANESTIFIVVLPYKK